jgi:hypothetical protein
LTRRWAFLVGLAFGGVVGLLFGLLVAGVTAFLFTH